MLIRWLWFIRVSKVVLLQLIRRVSEVANRLPVCAVVAAPKDAVLEPFSAVVVLTIDNLLNLVFFFVINNQR